MEGISMAAVTECLCKEVNFKWTIKNFSFFKIGYSVRSPKFSVELDKGRSTWKICLNPGSEYTTGGFTKKLFVKTDLCAVIPEGGPFDSFLAKYQFILSNTSRKMIFKSSSKTQVFSRTVTNNSMSGSFPELANRDVTLRESLLREISNDDILIVTCKLKVLNDIKDSPSSQLISHRKLSETHKDDNIAKFWLKSDLSDIIISIQGTEFKAHKIILASRSSVFFSMFKHEMKEANLGKVEISDIEPPVFERFLEYIYTGNTTVKDYVVELLVVADKYDVQDLKTLCEETLIKNIDTENCVKTLVLSDLHSAKRLKESTLDFIVSKKLDLAQNGLLEIEDPLLLKEIIEAFANKKK